MAITKPFAHREWVSSFVRSFFFQRCFWLGALVTFSIFASFLQILCVAFISIVDLLIYSKTPSSFEATGISAFTSGRWRLLHLKHQTFQLFYSIWNFSMLSSEKRRPKANPTEPNLNYRSTHVRKELLFFISTFRWDAIQMECRRRNADIHTCRVHVLTHMIRFQLTFHMPISGQKKIWSIIDENESCVFQTHSNNEN